jgi:hypothetical protein
LSTHPPQDVCSSHGPQQTNGHVHPWSSQISTTHPSHRPVRPLIIFSKVRLGPPVMRASSYTSGNRPAPDDIFESTLWPPPVDILEPADNSCQQGGHIASPRPSNKEQQARQMHVSIFDIAGLASPKYHGDEDGVSELSVLFIHTCRYQSFSPETSNDVLLCYCDIQQVHKKVCKGWYNPRTNLSGPSIERILERGILVFPKLVSLTAAATVTFYNKLQEFLAVYLTPLMPFDALCIKFNFKGLFLPGLGTDCYADCASAFMEILPRLLPTPDLEVEAKISAVCSKSKNGYDLLWRILELAIPGFDPTITIEQPRWTRDTNILEFCRGHELNFRLLAKKTRSTTLGPVPTCSCAALPRWTMLTLSQCSNPISICTDTLTNKGFLPQHLCLNGIATMLHDNTKAHVHDIGTPRLHMTRGFTPESDSVDKDELPYYHIQGYCPRVFRLDQGNDRATTGQYNDHSAGMRNGRTFDRCRLDCRGSDCRGERPGGGRTWSPPHGWFTRPTNAATLSYQMCNAMLVSGLDTRRPTATCLLSLFLLIATSKRICQIHSVAPSRRHGLLVGRTGLEVPLGCLARLCVLIAITTTSHLTTST